MGTTRSIFLAIVCTVIVGCSSSSIDTSGSILMIKTKALFGNTEVRYKLAQMYVSGEGVPKDSAKAAAWFQKAAEQGHHWAQINLGQMYERGEGVQKDLVKAAEWYEKAAVEPFARSQLARLRAEERYGETIQCRATNEIAMRMGYNMESTNKNIENAICFIKRDTGLLTIKFDYIANKYDPRDWKGLPLMRFFIRTLDKNGQYLDHFETEEVFVTRQMKLPSDTIDLLRYGNELQYEINLRDSSFVGNVEFGAIMPRW